MNKSLTAIKHKITLNGYTAIIKFDKENNTDVYVTWKHPDGEIIEDWEPYSHVLDQLLSKVRDWVSDRPQLTLWSY